MLEGQKYTYHYCICPKCGEKIMITKTLSGYTSLVSPEEAEEAF